MDPLTLIVITLLIWGVSSVLNHLFTNEPEDDYYSKTFDHFQTDSIEEISDIDSKSLNTPTEFTTDEITDPTYCYLSHNIYHHICSSDFSLSDDFLSSESSFDNWSNTMDNSFSSWDDWNDPWDSWNSSWNDWS